MARRSAFLMWSNSPLSSCIELAATGNGSGTARPRCVPSGRSSATCRHAPSPSPQHRTALTTLRSGVFQTERQPVHWLVMLGPLGIVRVSSRRPDLVITAAGQRVSYENGPPARWRIRIKGGSRSIPPYSGGNREVTTTLSGALLAHRRTSRARYGRITMRPTRSVCAAIALLPLIAGCGDAPTASNDLTQIPSVFSTEREPGSGSLSVDPQMETTPVTSETGVATDSLTRGPGLGSGH